MARLDPWDKQAAMRRLAEEGCVLAALGDDFDCARVGDRFAAALRRQDRDGKQILHDHGQVYGARNVIDWFPDPLATWFNASMREFVVAVLGPTAGLVRMLYFDKPPEASWSLPWHRDQTIAVEEPLPAMLAPYSKPTKKANVRHVEADQTLLGAMLTARVHLDACDANNGALNVLPGSHAVDGHADLASVHVEARAGDVLWMRPLLVHASGQGAGLQGRRILHYEFAPLDQLARGYHWKWRIPLVQE